MPMDKYTALIRDKKELDYFYKLKTFARWCRDKDKIIKQQRKEVKALKEELAARERGEQEWDIAENVGKSGQD